MSAPNTPPADPPRPAPARPGVAPRALAPAGKGEPIPSEALFGGATEVQIVHRGALYRLKQTSLGKLILTK